MFADRLRYREVIHGLLVGEGHAEILIETGEGFDFVIAVVALHTLMKMIVRQEVHELRKDRSSSVHWLLLV